MGRIEEYTNNNRPPSGLKALGVYEPVIDQLILVLCYSY